MKYFSNGAIVLGVPATLVVMGYWFFRAVKRLFGIGRKGARSPPPHLQLSAPSIARQVESDCAAVPSAALAAGEFGCALVFFLGHALAAPH